jgi:hypothetical protein
MKNKQLSQMFEMNQGGAWLNFIRIGLPERHGDHR